MDSFEGMNTGAFLLAGKWDREYLWGRASVRESVGCRALPWMKRPGLGGQTSIASAERRKITTSRPLGLRLNPLQSSPVFPDLLT